jgi:CBS domain-containing protein
MRRLSDIVRNQHPVTLRPGATVKHACESMRKHKVGAVLVTDEQDRLIGIFTGRDAVGRVLAEGRNAETTTLADVMTRTPVCVAPARSAIDALRLMHHTGCRHIPIVEHDKVVGVVSKADFRGVEVDRLDEETGLWENI